MKKFISILLVLSLSFSLFACKNNTSLTDDKNKIKVSEPEKVPEVKEKPKFYAPFTGEEVSEESFKSTPYFVIIENLKAARPQSGMIAGDIVYETMAEGGIPRTIVLFQSKSVEKIGPVRSARPYFLDLVKEYNLPFGHCGGSEEALNIIRKDRLMSLDEMAYTSTYLRDKERKAPHNLYTSTEKMINTAIEKSYDKTPNAKFTFDKEYWDKVVGTPGNTIDMKLSSYYSTSYSYKDGKYLKSMDGAPAMDKETKTQLSVKNIIIQKTNITLQKDKIHVDIKLIGNGTGYFISNGKVIEMNWERKDKNSQTIIKDKSGNPIPFNVGNTWWNIIDNSNAIQIN